jgi:hypothetical protein
LQAEYVCLKREGRGPQRTERPASELFQKSV